MSDYVPCSSTFEQLPNELLLLIFEYLNLHFVYDGFFGLNQRFNSLLASNLLPPNILTLCLYRKKDNPYQNFYDFFASRIFELTIDLYKSDDSYDLFNFPNVHSLILKNPSAEQCEKVNFHTLPHLKYLQVDKDSSSKHRNNFYFNAYDISHLNSICINDSCFRIRWSNADSFLYTLRSLTIITEEPYDVYLQIIVGCPNLIRLQIKFWSNYNHRMQRNPISHLNLRRLIINAFKDLSSEMLEFMLSNVPNLTHLTVTNSLVDLQYDTLATILTRYTMHLKVLQIALKVCSHDDEYIRTCIRQAHPLFFHVEWFYPECGNETTYMKISSKNKCQNGRYINKDKRWK